MKRIRNHLIRPLLHPPTPPPPPSSEGSSTNHPTTTVRFRLPPNSVETKCFSNLSLPTTHPFPFYPDSPIEPRTQVQPMLSEVWTHTPTHHPPPLSAWGGNKHSPTLVRPNIAARNTRLAMPVPFPPHTHTRTPHTSPYSYSCTFALLSLSSLLLDVAKDYLCDRRINGGVCVSQIPLPLPERDLNRTLRRTAYPPIPCCLWWIFSRPTPRSLLTISRKHPQ